MSSLVIAGIASVTRFALARVRIADHVDKRARDDLP